MSNEVILMSKSDLHEDNLGNNNPNSPYSLVRDEPILLLK